MTPSSPPPRDPGLAVLVLAAILPAARVLVAATLLTGVAYPLVVTAAAWIVAPTAAAGSPVRDARGNVRGSLHVGQTFSGEGWFHGRPSGGAAGSASPWMSGGSNLSPGNPRLAADVARRVAEARARHGLTADAAVPVDLVTASGSGLDPHVSPAAALLQVPRVARARRLPEADLRAVVLRGVEPRMFGLLGQPRVNVLLLNRALAEGIDGPQPSPPATSGR